MEPFRDDNELMAELRGLRPQPHQEFTAELDERAAAGFPRRLSRAGSPFGNLFTRRRALSPRRLALSGGAVALAAVAAATVVVAVNEPEGNPASIWAIEAGKQPTVQHGFVAPPQGEALANESKPPKRLREIKPFSQEIPSSAGVARATAQPSLKNSNSSLSLKKPNSFFDGAGPYASRAPHREVERSAEMVLGAEPDEVAGAATEVFDAVHAVDGIVLSSSVTGGAEGDAGARFDLLIPAAKLGDALADFSAIAAVVSRHEATDDITAPTVRTSEHLRDSRARIDGLLTQLAGADSDEERGEVEVELRAERRHAAALRSGAAKLGRRANLSRVSLRIETGAGASAPGDGGSWGIGDALGDAGHILGGDAGHILGVAAGVTIVGLAILAPLALIAFLAWLANRARLRRARERALA